MLPRTLKVSPVAKMEVPESSQININQENGFDNLTCKLFSYRCNDLVEGCVTARGRNGISVMFGQVSFPLMFSV